MGEYDKKPARAAATAGPSADDRYGPGPIATNLKSRIIRNDIVDGRTLITIARGSGHGIRVGMEGYVRGRDGIVADFQIHEVRGAATLAFIDVTPDELRDNLEVVINPTDNGRKAIVKETSSRVISLSIEGDRTKIVIGLGSANGVTRGMRGQLRSDDGAEGDDFQIHDALAKRSFAYIRNTPDYVRAHSNVVLHPNPRYARSPVQRRANDQASSSVDVQATAQAGVAGATSRLPHFDTIQRAFGKHDISGVQAQVGGPAADAAGSLGARAYATGDKVAFASAPDLHTAAHEAAHTVQQSRGAVGFQGLGAADDEHERHADAVADAVVAGNSAAPILDRMGGGGGGSDGSVVQRKTDSTQPPPSSESSEHKEPSWIQPMARGSEDPAQVGSVFFRTKQAQIDARDRELFADLARANAQHAKRNLGQPGKPLGLGGKVVGYADPRRSSEPSNRDLSEQRAHVVATAVERALASATMLDVGDFHLTRVGAGVASDAVANEPLGEGNTLAPFRRADIFLERVDVTREPTAVDQPTEKGEAMPATTLGPDAATEQSRKQIEAGDWRTIRDVVQLRLATFDNGMETGRIVDLNRRVSTVNEIAKKHGVGMVVEDRPPWWRGGSAPPRYPSQGRSAASNANNERRGVLAHLAIEFLNDWMALVAYSNSAEVRQAFIAYANLKDPLQLYKATRPMRYLLWMYDDLKLRGRALLAMGR